MRHPTPYGSPVVHAHAPPAQTGGVTVFHLVFALMVTRASLDLPISMLSINVGGKPISAGALLNLCVVLGGLWLALRGRRLIIPRVVMLAWAPFLVMSFIAIAYTPEMVGALRKFLVSLSYVSIMLIACRFDLVTRNEGILVRILLLSSVVPILYVPVELATSSFGLPAHRVKSVFPHPNILAFYAVLLILYFYHFLSKRNLLFSARHCLIYASIIGLTAALLLTQTRAAWAALYVSVLIYSTMTRPRLAPIIAIVPVLAMVEPTIRERVLEVFQAPGVDVNYLTDVIQGRVPGSERIVLNSYEWRKVIWEYAFTEAWKRPVIGHGLDSFMYYSRTFSPLSNDATGAHSMYVKYLFELGFVGLFVFIGIFVYLLAKSLNYWTVARNDCAFVISCILFYLIICYSDNIIGYLSFNWYFWFIIGSYFAYLARCRRTLNHARNIRAEFPSAERAAPARLLQTKPNGD